MRQLGHPVWEKPEKGDLAGFILHNEDTIPQNLFGKITRAWEKMNIRENKLKRKDPSIKESYTQWVKERVQMINPT